MRKKTAILYILSFLILSITSCTVEPTTNSLIGDDKKIDIKGSLTNGDMKHPNVEAGYWNNAVHVYFHDYLGVCVVSVSDKHDTMLFADTLRTNPQASSHFFMGDLPKRRYHLVISNGTDKAEGWFYNYRILAN